MSNVVNIFYEFDNPNANHFEKIIFKEIKICLNNFLHLIKIFIYENQRKKRGYRHINFRTNVNNWIIEHTKDKEHVERLFQEYIEIYGSTQYIKRKRTFFYTKIIPFFEKSLKKYNHLIDIN
jgi:hypothetical protein